MYQLSLYKCQLFLVAGSAAIFAGYQVAGPEEKIAVDRVSCTGSEDSLASCTYTTSPGQTCTHALDAGVRCTNLIESECFEGGSYPVY